MKSKVFFSCLVILFIITGIFCSTTKEEKIVVKEKGKPRIIVDSAEFNFGEIPEGSEATHFFIVTNQGTDTLKINNLETSCGCTAATLGESSLPPKSTTKIRAVFNSRGRIGYNEKTVVIFSNDPVEPQKQLLLKGKVIPKAN